MLTPLSLVLVLSVIFGLCPLAKLEGDANILSGLEFLALRNDISFLLTSSATQTLRGQTSIINEEIDKLFIWVAVCVILVCNVLPYLCSVAHKQSCIHVVHMLSAMIAH